MRANVFLRHYTTKKKEKRYLLIVREAGRKDSFINLGAVSKKVAEQRRVITHNELLNGKYQRVSTVRPFFGEFCDRFIKECLVGTLAPKTVKSYQERLKPLKKEFKGWRLDQIHQEGLERFLNGLPVSGRTKNMTLSCLRGVFQKAVDWKYLTSSPVHKIKRWREDSQGSRALTQEELGRLLDMASPWLSSIIKVMMTTGVRPGELSQLKFEDIDWENHSLKIVSDRIRKTKSRKSRIIPMTTDLEEELGFLKQSWLDPYFGANGHKKEAFFPRTKEQSQYIFCHRNGNPITIFKKGLKELFKKAGIQGVTPHGLRKTFATMLARQKTHPKAAQLLLGHSDIAVTMKIYTEIADDQLREAVDSLPTIRALKKEKFRIVEGAK